VIKNLGRFYRHVKVVSGATILGDGTVALILDPERLAQDAVRALSQSTRGRPSLAAIAARSKQAYRKTSAQTHKTQCSKQSSKQKGELYG
jgi:chemotaxis protein histidine kinase CheA